MFEHQLFRVYSFAEVPLDRDLYLMDERWMREWETGMIRMFDGGKYPVVGYVSHAAARAIDANSIELSWYPNVHTRFHEMKIALPRNQFITCVDCWQHDIDPFVFVRHKWLSHIHLRAHSIFAFVDAIGVKDALLKGSLSRGKLVRLRRRIDTIASHYPKISFISFADSLLLKTNWYVGQYNSKTKYSYEPERMFKVLSDIRKAYLEVLGMNVYAILTQGSNEYFNDALLHTANNHVSLNSLGLPFAQLLSIDGAAREAIRTGRHGPFDLYLDEDFYRSLHLRYEYRKEEKPKALYRLPMGTGPGYYYFASYSDLMNNLDRRRKN